MSKMTARLVSGLLVFAFVATIASAGISVSAPTYAPGVFTVFYGLGTPAPGKIAYVKVTKPNGYTFDAAQAENVPDYSQVCYVYADIPGSYRFYYEYSFYSQGVPRTTVFYQDYYVNPAPRDIRWDSVSAPSIGTPYQSVRIQPYFTNTGGYDYGSDYYIEYKDTSQTPIYYASINGIRRGYSGTVYTITQLPNIGGIGTATYHLRALQNGVTYFGQIRDVPIIIDYPPTTSLSVSTTLMTRGDVLQITSVSSDLYSNLINQAIDYLAPGSSSWGSGTASLGTRWDGSPTYSNTLSPRLVLMDIGTWQFRSRGQDSYGQLSPFVYQNVVVRMPIGVTLTLDSSNVAVNQSTTARSLATPAGEIVYHGVEGRMTSPSVGSWQNWGIWNDSGGNTQSTPVSASTTGTYEVRAYAARSDGVSTYSASTFLNVSSPAPVITSSPGNQTVTQNQSVTFTVTASGTAPLRYQWSRNDSPLSGATNASYTIASVQPADAGRYACTVTNDFGSATSATAILTVYSAPVFTAQPVNQTPAPGGSAVFAVAATGNPGPTFQWQRKPNGSSSWTNVADDGGYAGATSATLTVSGVTAAQSGDQFQCVATNAVGSATSAAASLTVGNGTQADPQNLNQLNIHTPY